MSRRKLYRVVGFVAWAVAIGIVSAGAEEARFFVSTRDKTVFNSDLTIELSRQGEIIGAAIGGRMLPYEIAGGSRLAGCKTVGEVVAEMLADGRVRFRRTVVANAGGHEAVLIDTFRPMADSVRWEIELIGKGAPWTAPIETWLKWPDAAEAKFWTAWSDPRPGGGVDWTDPLVPSPFVDRQLGYVARGHVGFSIPLVVILDESNDVALSLVMSPEDTVFDMGLRVSCEGGVAITRSNHRIQEGRPVRFAMDLVAHLADWRGGLGWMVQRYRPYFDPPNPVVHQIAGCGAYSSHADITNPNKLMRIGFRVNWKASYDFPFMGMFLPPVSSDTEQWIDFKQRPNSIAQMREYVRNMRRMGFHVLSYFNVTECGAHYVYPPPPRKAKADKDLWRDANDFLHYQVGEAILPGEDGEPLGSWEGCVAMDPGEPVYQDFLIDQARRHVEKLPESAGICIDRLDWLSRYNPRRDDGASWVDNKPARAMVVSWQEVSERLDRVMHDAGKVILVNPFGGHLGWLRHVDGIYSEWGDFPATLNRIALMGIRKPVIAWTRDAAAVTADPDAYFQRHLHLGVYLTAPVSGNDHCILPHQGADSYYRDYGPMLSAIRGKQWLLLPHVIEVVDKSAKVNIFEVPGGYVIPITFGQSDHARLLLRGLPRLAGQEGFRTQVIHPGQTDWAPLALTDRGDSVSIDVPLVRGCAMVKLAYAWIDPAITWFNKSAMVEMGTTVRDAVMRYTLDGSEPSATSGVYKMPLKLDKTTLVRASAFRDDKSLGQGMTVEFVRLPADAPRTEPHGGK